MAFSVFIWFFHANPVILHRDLMQAIPRKVKAILDQPSLSPEQLLALPRLERGCFLGLAVPMKPLGLSNGDIAREVGVYSGSSVNKEGGIGKRMEQHRGAIRNRLAGKTIKGNWSRFYQFAAWKRGSTPFFTIARLPRGNAAGGATAQLLEGLVQAYLDLVRTSKATDTRWH